MNHEWIMNHEFHNVQRAALHNHECQNHNLFNRFNYCYSDNIIYFTYFIFKQLVMDGHAGWHEGWGLAWELKLLSKRLNYVLKKFFLTKVLKKIRIFVN